MGITAEQIKLLKDGFLKTVGSNKANLPVLESALSLYAKAFIETASNNIDKAGRTYKGNLQSDLEFRVVETAGQYTIEIGYPKNSISAKYYDYQNKGVAGVGKASASPYSFKNLAVSKNMVASIKEWVVYNNIAGRNEDQTKGLSKLQRKRKSFQDAAESTAYGIALGIKRKGIKPTYFFDKAITKTFDNNFRKIIAQALGADVVIKIRKDGDNN
jgi:hypothetical protein